MENCAECNGKGNKCEVCNEGYKRKLDGICHEIIIPGKKIDNINLIPQGKVGPFIDFYEFFSD